MARPKTLLLDIETSPIIAYVWGLWENNVALNQIHTDWHVLSWSAKWLGEPASKVMYQDQRNAKVLEDDSKILKGLWKLLNEAEVIITQNGKKFDQKKLNARFIHHGFTPPAPFKHIDTMLLAKKHFGFTSNKLEYMTDKLCVKYKKQKHKKFSGFELWRECMAGNVAAWNEMKKYNVYDVLSLEELYTKLIPWDGGGTNVNLYSGDDDDIVCGCGSDEFQKRGFHYTNSAKYQRYQCSDCGAWTRGRDNLISPYKRFDLRVGVSK